MLHLAYTKTSRQRRTEARVYTNTTSQWQRFRAHTKLSDYPHIYATATVLVCPATKRGRNAPCHIASTHSRSRFWRVPLPSRSNSVPLGRRQPLANVLGDPVQKAIRTVTGTTTWTAFTIAGAGILKQQR